LGYVVFSYFIHDPAGRGIALKISSELHIHVGAVSRGNLKELGQFENLVIAGFDVDVLFMDFLAKYFPEAKFFIILSRHSSAAAIPSLTVHHTGNFTNEALYGGKPHELGIANPEAAYIMLRKLHELSRDAGLTDFEISYEATHHGPTSVEKPLTFIEIGSTEKEWIRDDAQYVVAKAALEVYHVWRRGFNVRCEPCIGVGGGHYARKHTRMCIERGFCYGHIISKHVLERLKVNELERIIKTCIDRSATRPKLLVVEKKSVKSAYRSVLKSIAPAYSLEYVEI